MSHFYGTVRGMAETSRRGSKSSGLVTESASWQGAVRVELEHRDVVDFAHVSLVPWQNNGVHRLLYHGPVNANDAKLTQFASYALDVMGRCR